MLRCQINCDICAQVGTTEVTEDNGEYSGAFGGGREEAGPTTIWRVQRMRGWGGQQPTTPSISKVDFCLWVIFFSWDFSKKLKNATCPAFGGGFAPKDDAGADTSSSVHTLFRQWICIETKTLQRDIFITVSLYHCFGTQSCVVSQTIHWIGSRF